MVISLEKPGTDGLGEAVEALREWQSEGVAWQVHPGDLGWYWRNGAPAVAEAVRIWRRDGRILAVGFLDGADLLRLTTAPDVRRDEELARRLAEDVAEPDRGVLPAGKVSVEAPMDALLQDVLPGHGWHVDDEEPWTPLSLDLTEPVKAPDLRIETVGADLAAGWAEVIGAAFGGSTFTAEKWRTMAASAPYADARCLLGYDDHGDAVAAVAVWSAGPGKPGLLEPMGVRADQRGHGYGRAITVAAAAALRELGSSSAAVNTPSSNVAAVTTYKSGGFRPWPEIRDLTRDAS
ncbi:GNAT family N-acetyltransferase [Amycolatopsis keratiniphila]|uniref:GNAT family N-acetyltransferase n=1 Tax=Amycolatopsis keratiniphila TaxID=129921 RepID=UPI00087A91D8|nr:GNAT family N-acetyltransferase [Amycolatopsis keratiniphila]OLZ48768.1 GNAT family N-acetyltransferase [Amycolatopsis keratiniphila subsp. nogabecina]SDU34423.1 Acetyltransferase (GNAT) family protein [Amycolatopsis keratiniphila]